MIIQALTNPSPKTPGANGTVVAMRAIAAHLRKHDNTQENFDWIVEDMHENFSSEIVKL